MSSYKATMHIKNHVSTVLLCFFKYLTEPLVIFFPCYHCVVVQDSSQVHESLSNSVRTTVELRSSDEKRLSDEMALDSHRRAQCNLQDTQQES